jgi:hypothetical protein
MPVTSTVSTEPLRGRRSPSGARRIRRAHRTTDVERRLIVATAVIAGVGAAFAGGEPTGFAPSDVLLRFGFATVVTLASSRARRWTWIVLAGVAGVAAEDGTYVLVGGVALTFAIAGSLLSRRRLVGALAGALSMQVLLRLGDFGFSGASALLVLAAVAPVLVSGYLLSPRRHRHLVRRVALWSLAFSAVATVLFGVSVGLAMGGVRDGIDRVRDGLAAAGDGDLQRANALFDRGGESLDSASGFLGAFWAKPARVVPGLGQQARALDETTAEAANVADAASAAAATGDFDQIRYESGQIDLRQIEDARGPLAAAVVAMDEATAQLEAVDSPWLLPPVRDRMDRFAVEIFETRDEVYLASLASRELPALLGGDGPRHYLVMFTQPAETRGLGGFLGAWVELRAVDGDLDVVESGKSTELNRSGDCKERTISDVPDYLARYGRFRPQCFIQDIPFSPDFPTVAEVMRQMYSQTRGVELDGVMMVDPYGLEAILQITGPVNVPGFSKRLAPNGAAEYLLRQQYIDYVGDEDTRDDFLEAALRETFDQLVEGDIPGPRKVGSVLGPAVEQRHLMGHAFVSTEQELFDEVDAGGALSPPGDGDAFLLVTQNKGNNKIDTYLERAIEYDVDVDPSTGALKATAIITLENAAPDEGLPDAIIGSNDQGLPPGMNKLFFSFYTPHRLVNSTIDKSPLLLESQREMGWSVYSWWIDVPSGESRVIELTLAGDITPGNRYVLDVGRQPVANPDSVSIDVQFPPSAVVQDADGLGLLGDGRTVGTRFVQIVPRQLVVELTGDR